MTIIVIARYNYFISDGSGTRNGETRVLGSGNSVVPWRNGFKVLFNLAQTYFLADPGKPKIRFRLSYPSIYLILRKILQNFNKNHLFNVEF